MMRGMDIDSIFACDSARRLHGAALADALRDSRRITWSRVQDLSDAQWQVPRQPGLNPVAWELAHVAWFAEFWTGRGPHRVGDDGLVHAARPPRHCGPDAHHDSARLPHAQRWDIAWPGRAVLAERLAAQLEATLQAVQPEADDGALYFHRLALFHEDMHAEAFTWLRATLALPCPEGLALPGLPAARDELAIAGGPVVLGCAPATPGFAFDNEQPGLRIDLAPYRIDSRCVTQDEFRAFVDAGGYDEPAFWPGAAGAWRAASGRSHPARWRRTAQGWQQRWFDRWQPLQPAAPVVHVNAWEAEAWCRWAGRRLPRAAEWEQAAATQPGFHWGGSVWEWTADDFAPYPGFAPGPYKDYSAPWFGDHRELRGGAFATHARLHDRRYRNFFGPARSDVFAGFRSAAG